MPPVLAASTRSHVDFADKLARGGMLWALTQRYQQQLSDTNSNYGVSLAFLTWGQLQCSEIRRDFTPSSEIRTYKVNGTH